MRIIVTIAMILLSAQFAAVQPADPDGPKRLTLGVSTLHQFTVIGGYETNFVPLGLHAGWRLKRPARPARRHHAGPREPRVR